MSTKYKINDSNALSLALSIKHFPKKEANCCNIALIALCNHQLFAFVPHVHVIIFIM